MRDKLYRVFNLHRLVIYSIITLTMLAVLVRPVGIPLVIGRDARAFFNVMNELGSGDVVVISAEFGVPAAPECLPQLQAIAHHAHSRGAQIILLAMHPDGEPFVDQVLNELIAVGARYGEDVVHLGFVPGGEAGIAALMADLHGTVPNDFRGVPLGRLPLTAGVRNAKDLAVVVPITSDATAPEFWTRQMAPYPHAKLLMAAQAALWPRVQPFIPTGQIVAGLAGTPGTAEYELLLNRRGLALAQMDAISVAYLTFVGFIVLGNIAHYLKPRITAGSDSK